MTAGRPLRFGLIGVDSSHALQFTRLFGDGHAGRVPGGQVIAAWQGPTSEDFPPSRDRNEANAAVLAEMGVDLLPSPEAVAEVTDALLLVSSDARTRRDQFTSIAAAGLPVYVDTRFAADPADAVAMMALAAENDCLVLSGSPKRFTPAFRSALSDLPLPRSADLTGPLVVQPGHPGLSWYGVHLVDLAVAALGADCTSVEPARGGVRLRWADGRTATLSGPAEWSPWTRGRLLSGERRSDFEVEANEEMLTGLLGSVIASCRTGVPNIDSAEILAICRIVAAGNEALSTRSAVEVDRGPVPLQPE